MKEMQRQAKALREDRRAGLDVRHKWIFGKVSLSFFSPNVFPDEGKEICKI